MLAPTACSHKQSLPGMSLNHLVTPSICCARVLPDCLAVLLCDARGKKKGTRQCYVFFSNSYPTILSFCSFFLDSSPCPPIQAYPRKVGMYVVCKSKSIHGTAHPWSLPQPARRDLAQTTTLSTLVHIPILFRTLAMLGSSRGRLDMI